MNKIKIIILAVVFITCFTGVVYNLLANTAWWFEFGIVGILVSTIIGDWGKS